jgi:hypothetical protein
MKGVGAYIEQDGEEVKLTFDDIETEAVAAPTSWSKTALFTFNTYPEAELENMALSREQYAEIGENLILRLLALNGRLK